MSATTGTTAEMERQQESRVHAHAVATQVVICLGPWYEDATGELLAPLLSSLRESLGPLAPQSLIAYPATNAQATSWEHEGMLLQPYLPTARLHPLPVQTAATYLNLFEIMRAHNAACGLLLGPEAHTLNAAALRAMLEAVLGRNVDLVLPRYAIGDNQGLINSSILQPVTRAVFGVKTAFPLPLDLALSNRMAERMAAAAQRLTAAAQPEALMWPTTEAAIASYTVAEITAGARELPQPAGEDLSSILNTIAASLFADIEAKASFWQRTRPASNVSVTEAATATVPPADPVDTEEISELVESFRLGYGNLQEIWALVLPPQTLLGLKRLSRLPLEEFSLPDALWVRIIYDFVLAHRLRTINRGHLMGSLTPLYLAWVASHILAGQNGGNGSTESLARAFEADKPYLVSRWRWPDRFNP